MPEPEAFDEDDFPSEEDLLDLGELDAEEEGLEEHGLHLITLMYDTKAQDVPSLDLGDCPPWIAITLLQSAIDTLQMLIPPVDVTLNGKLIATTQIEMLEEWDEED